MNVYLTLALNIASIIFFIAFILFSFKYFNFQLKRKYSIKNMFPYELNFDGNFKFNMFGNVSLLLSLFSFLFSRILNSIIFKTGYFYSLLVIGTILVIASLGVIFISMRKYIKVNTVASVFLFAFSFADSTMTFLTNLNLYQSDNKPLYIVAMVLSGIIALTILIMFMNPKLTFNFKLIEKKMPNGVSEYLRPNFIYVAFSEWLSLFAIMANLIPLSIAILA